MKWIGSLLKWIESWSGNYLTALMVFATMVEIVLLPLAIYQQKNTIKQAKLRPKEMAIRKKYAGRTDNATLQKMRMETQELYQRENFNQFSGCLPLLIQFPIIILLYNTIINPLLYIVKLDSASITALQTFVTTAGDGLADKVTLTSTRGTIELVSIIREKGVDFFSGIKDFVNAHSSGEGAIEAIQKLGKTGEEIWNDISTKCSGELPNLNFGVLNLGKSPSVVFNSAQRVGNDWWLLLIPVLTFVLYYFSSKITRKFSYQAPTTQDVDAGCSYKIMDIGMPAMSTYFAFLVPGAVGIYWMFRSVLSTLKQFIILKIMPYPKFTEEDYKEAEREILGKSGGRRKTARADRDAAKQKLSPYADDDDDDGEYERAVKKSLDSNCELSKKSPYYDGPDDEPDEAENTENPSESENKAEDAADGQRSAVEKLPLKDDKNHNSKKKKK